MTNDESSLTRVRRSGADLIRLTGRDTAGLRLVAGQSAAPYHLLGTALGMQPSWLRQVMAHWEAADYARTEVLAPRPAWCWLTPAGLAACGCPWQASPLALARPKHLRAVLATRLWLTSTPTWQHRQARWRPERELRAGTSGAASRHVPDVEMIRPSVEGRPHTGQTWGHRVRAHPQDGRPYGGHPRRLACRLLRAGGPPRLPGRPARHPRPAARRPHAADGRIAPCVTFRDPAAEWRPALGAVLILDAGWLEATYAAKKVFRC
jgi:hypothetical protein